MHLNSTAIEIAQGDPTVIVETTSKVTAIPTAAIVEVILNKS